MKFKMTNKAPQALGIGEKTDQTVSELAGLLVRRSKKGYQVGEGDNWSVMFPHFSLIKDTEIDIVRERMPN